MEELAPQELTKVLRSVVFAEQQIRRSEIRDGPCPQVFEALTRNQAHNCCGESESQLRRALLAQGVSSSDLRTVTFVSEAEHEEAEADIRRMAERMPPGTNFLQRWKKNGHLDFFVGKDSKTPGHVVLLYRSVSKDGKPLILAIDPTLVQFGSEPFYKELQKTEVGQEILKETRKYGAWVVTEARYNCFVGALEKFYGVSHKKPYQSLIRIFTADKHLEPNPVLKRELEAIGPQQLKERVEARSLP